ncbi:DNA polymerase III subunit alpha [Peribacillus deserti]|uniref:DNA polymerase III subunit alpha n=1 Tax=Peribacillus deserti TaxID=673318 RepID=A0A2N5M9Y0_9BACI|nr:DNA polymerase III subunit alpha [Peribacillus deserti]PLT31172.1 DNA polymerase III subunit alpha [Peribacillus deserti]
MAFIHLHVQSAYSLLSGTASVKDLVAGAKAKNYEALALTDRNAMYGVIDFYKECLKQKIKPIIGLTADILHDDTGAFPLVLLAKNNKGYQNLLKISSAIKTKSPEGLPLKWLKAYSEGLTAITPGREGIIETLLLRDEKENALSHLFKFKSIFEEQSFYMAVHRTGRNEEERLNKMLVALSHETDTDLAAGNPVYYLERSDSLALEVLLAIRNGEKLSDENRHKLDTDENYLKGKAEMAELFHDLPEALENTIRIGESCNVLIEFNRKLLPKYTVDRDRTADEMLEACCEEGFRERYPDSAPGHRQRLRYELEIIKKMNFSDYFLIVWDFMRFARTQNILTGPGRGSAAGSMVAYVLRITDVDPLEHGLLFERFLNPERISMPDIDIDFPDTRRDEVISYVAKKYGELHVAQIITFGTMAAKAALRDVGRVFGLNQKELEGLSRMIPSRLGITLEAALKESKHLQNFVNENEFNRNLFQTALKLEGLPRHTSTHAAGIVISDKPLTELIPIQEGQEAIHLTQFPMENLEELGMLKMDFLGLRNLTLIENTLEMIQKGTGKRPRLDEIPLQDSDTFALLGKGETTGVFQLESEGMRNVLTKLKPTRFEDIVAVNALYRPGPMENIPLFIDRKHGIQPLEYPHIDLEPILKPTYGVIVYQEQIMQIAAKMAGFSLGEADLLRRAVSKKKKDVLDRERAHFVEGAGRQGYEENAANEIYDLIVRFANYGFNRSHAVAYSIIAYQLAYLKAHHFHYFMAALLTSVVGNEDKIAQYIREMKSKGIEVLPPSINRSHFAFKPEAQGIRYSIAAIKGIGAAAIREIFQARRKKPFEDLFDFCLRVSSKAVNRKSLEALVHSGAFDEFGEDRATLLASLDVALEHNELVNPDDDQFDLFANSEFTLKPKYLRVEPIRTLDKLELEKQALGLYLSDHPVTPFKKLFHYFGSISIHEAVEREVKKGYVPAYITEVKTIRTKKGETMAFLSVSDETGDLECVVFPNVYRKKSLQYKKGNVFMLHGSVETKDGKKQLIVEDSYSIEDLERHTNEEAYRLFIKVEKDKHTKQLLTRIKKLLQNHKGLTKVVLYYEKEDRYVQLPMDQWISAGEGCLRQLGQLVGPDNVVLKKR